MTRRFPNYQPSTALRQAIERLNTAKKDRAAADAEQLDDKPGQSGGPDALANTPGHEGTSNVVGLGHVETDLREVSDADALVSGRYDEN